MATRPKASLRRGLTPVLTALLVLTSVFQAGAAEETIDLSKSVIVADTNNRVHAKTAQMLQEEIEKRTGISLPVQNTQPGRRASAIVLAEAGGRLLKNAKGPAIPDAPEGYALWVAQTGKTVFAAGRDARGVLFAAGRLLRSLHMKEGVLTLDPGLSLATAPKYPMRGHQLGYRNTANSYDAWSFEQYEQYIRDLAVFGGNSIEMIPSLDPTEKESVHMDLTMWDMTVKVSALLDDYDLDLWLWVPVEGDVTDPEQAREELESKRVLFEACPRLDAVFVPGGDPGHTAPKDLLPWLEELAKLLHESHPDAGLWVSNQGFEHEQNDVFFGYLNESQPDWFTGVVFGPWAKIGIQEARERTPKQYALRRYPDITHCLRCQYPMPQWDQAFAHTLGREPVNPLPVRTAQIHNVFAPYSDGFVSYSDGIHDDVNKVIWSVLGWDPDADVAKALEEYGRYFIGQDFGEAVSKGLYALEENWVGPLAGNPKIEKTLAHWQDIEKKAGDLANTNWRLQLALLRAYYDAYDQRRLAQETAREEQAHAALRKAKSAGVAKAIAEARKALAAPDTDPSIATMRKHLYDMGPTLFKSIGMQLDVERYQARNAERGAVLEFLDQPLNNRLWLEAQFDAIEAETSTDAQLARIHTILNWENPGPGGFYDDLGNAARQPHLVRQKTWAEDPGGVESPQEEYSKGAGPRLSTLDTSQTLFGTPLRMRYEGLDNTARYRLRVVYSGRFRAVMRLMADGQHEIHGPMPQPATPDPVEFAVPAAATSDGVLELEWQLVEKRGCQVAEVWLIREP
jgi:Glycosyl hydrolase family 20, domain 2